MLPVAKSDSWTKALASNDGVERRKSAVNIFEDGSYVITFCSEIRVAARNAGAILMTRHFKTKSYHYVSDLTYYVSVSSLTCTPACSFKTLDHASRTSSKEIMMWGLRLTGVVCECTPMAVRRLIVHALRHLCGVRYGNTFIMRSIGAMYYVPKMMIYGVFYTKWSLSY